MTNPPTGSSSGESSKAPILTSAAFITFYSFKGGVGRSMALINTACILAGTRGFRVLVIDLDLEAPGLSYLNTESPDTPSSSERPPTSPHLGFVDLITDAKARGEDADLFCLQPDALADKYTRQVRIPDSDSEFKDGTLHIMPAGRLDDGYTRRLDELDLNGLYRDGIGEPLMRAFKQRIGKCGLYDYVLVDSRTGISEGAGICTRDLADHVMVLSGLNRQNVEGTSKFLKEFKAMTNDSKTVQVILSPVPNGEDDLLERRRSEAAQKFKLALGRPVDLSIEIPYHPQLALTEEPHIFRSKRGYLFEAYRRIEASMLRALEHTAEAVKQQALGLPEDADAGSILRILDRLVRLPEGLDGLRSVVRQFLQTQPDAGMATLPPRQTKWPFTQTAPKRPQLAGIADFIVRHLRTRSDAESIAKLVIAVYEESDSLGAALAERVMNLHSRNGSMLSSMANQCRLAKRMEIAERFYQRATGADQYAQIGLFNYAHFLRQQRRLDEARAVLEGFAKHAGETDKHYISVASLLSQWLVADGLLSEADVYITRLLARSDLAKDTRIELVFCQLVAFPEHWPSKLAELSSLIGKGGLAILWDAEEMVQRAIQVNHPNIPLLRSLAAVSFEGADPATLDVYPEWQAAKAGPPN